MSQDPGLLTLWADRHAPLVRTLTIENLDGTGATFRLQVRATWEADGAALVDLSTVTVQGDEGVRLVGVAPIDGVLTTVLEVVIGADKILPLPAHPTDPSLPGRCAWDLQITPFESTADVYLRGPFKIRPGVTR